MRVRDTLNLPSLEQACVVSGEEGLDNEVSSAMVLEAPDIENWGREGQLIITSFYALQNLSDVDMEAFFEKMSVIGISGVIFKTERLVSDIPSILICLSNRHGMPIIRVPKSTRYEPIMLDVLGNVINSNLTVLNRFFSAHQQTMALALTHPSVLDIISELSTAIRMDVTFFNQTRDQRVSTSQGLGDFRALSFNEIEKDRYQGYHYYETALSYGGGRVCEALSVAIPSSDRNRYYLLIHGPSERLTRLDVMTIENIAGLLQMEVLKENALDQRLFIQNNALVHDLLLDRFSNHEQVDMTLEQLGIASEALYQVVMVRVSTESQGDRSEVDRVVRAVRRHVKRLFRATAYFESNDRVAIIGNFADEARALSVGQVTTSLDELLHKGTLPEFTYLAAISNCGDRYSLGELNSEVISINRLFGGSMGTSHCIRFRDLGVLKLLLRVGEDGSAREYVDPRLLRLRDERPELAETLVAFFENGGNYQETARAMFLHPKTVRYRISLAEQMVGIDVRNSDDFLQIAFMGKILEIMPNEL